MAVGDLKLDIFGSIFRSSVKTEFELAPPTVSDMLVVSDRDAAQTAPLLAQAQALLSTVDGYEQFRWRVLNAQDWTQQDMAPIPKLLALLADNPPDMVVTWRHLMARESGIAWTLGAVVDTLTQAIDSPVLLLPAPEDTRAIQAMDGTRNVLVVTDHLTGDDRLVNWGVHMTWREGTLYLAHVEDDATLARYLDVIGRLPQVNSEQAASLIPDKLLALPRGYIESVTEVLRDQAINETVVPLVRMGHALTDYKALIDAHELDLLIFESKDINQTAMAGMAHALAVEIRHKPLLLL